jgi:hypothetical protein
VLVCVTACCFSLSCMIQAIKHMSENPKRAGQVGPVPVGVGLGQLRADRHRLLRW